MVQHKLRHRPAIEKHCSRPTYRMCHMCKLCLVW